MDRARAELERADVAWSEAASAARDVEQIVSFWTDDATVIPPGQPPIIGKNAIRNYVTASLKIPGFSILWKTTRFTIAQDCDLAYGVGTNQVSFNDEKGNRVTLRGRAVTIWRKENGGGGSALSTSGTTTRPLSEKTSD